MKKLLSIVMILCILFGTMQITLAAEETGDPVAEPSYNISIGEGEENVDVVYDVRTRGDFVPTSSTALPYTISGNIKNYTYSNYYFKPSSIGKIHTQLKGKTYYMFDVTVTIKLYDKAGNYLTKFTTSSGYSFDQGISWYNLDANTYYYFEVSVSNKWFANESLDFSLKCTAQTT